MPWAWLQRRAGTKRASPPSLTVRADRYASRQSKGYNWTDEGRAGYLAGLFEGYLAGWSARIAYKERKAK